MKKFDLTLQAAKGEQILAVIAGLPVDSNGFFLSEEQMGNVEATLAANATAATEAAAALATATEVRTTAEASLATANQTVATHEARIRELEAENAELGRKAAGGIQPTATQDPDTPPVDPAKGKANKYETSVDREAKKYFNS